MSVRLLAEKWTVSRGYQTAGWNICSLTDTTTEKRYHCKGGGYDMTGTVFADWLADNFQAELIKLSKTLTKRSDIENARYWIPSEFYGMYIYSDHVGLDGGCGLDSMIRIAEAVGIQVQKIYTRRMGSLGFTVIIPD